MRGAINSVLWYTGAATVFMAIVFLMLTGAHFASLAIDGWLAPKKPAALNERLVVDENKFFVENTVIRLRCKQAMAWQQWYLEDGKK